MAISATSHIILGAHKPKKDAVVGTGDPTVPAGDDDVAIWANNVTNANMTQYIVGDFHKLHRWAQTFIKDNNVTTWVAMQQGGSDKAISVGAPGAGDVGLYVGANVAGGDKSHFLDRTFKRLIERWLEESKGGTGGAIVVPAGFVDLGNNRYQAVGDWRDGLMVQIDLTLRDPDGQTEQDRITWEVNTGTDLMAAVVALAQAIDNLVHYTVEYDGDTLTIMPSSEDYTVRVEVMVA